MNRLSVSTASLAISVSSLVSFSGSAQTVVQQLSQSGSSLVHGIPPGCSNAMYLLAVRVTDLLAIAPVIDRDGDGALTAEDTVLTIEQMLASSFGDVNQDHVINSDDGDEFVLELIAGGEDTPRIDTSTDGFLDLDDADAVLNPDVTQVPIHYRSLASRLYGLVSAIEWSRNPDSLRGAVGPGTRVPQPHVQSISHYPSTHSAWQSMNYPNNHIIEVTRNWTTPPAPGPNHTTAVSDNRHTLSSSKSTWPPNHSFTVSETWEIDSHSYARSELWYPHPNHAVVASTTWPGNHSFDTSDGYPPGHQRSYSTTREPTPHAIAVSASWYPPSYPPNGPHESYYSNNPTHGKQNSDNWPPSHHMEVSDSWPPMHGLAASLLWPPGHVTRVSGGWPPDRRPLWPPNHVQTRSEQDQLPTKPLLPNWPLLPEGHSYLTTVKDFYGIFVPPDGGEPCVDVR